MSVVPGHSDSVWNALLGVPELRPPWLGHQVNINSFKKSPCPSSANLMVTKMHFVFRNCLVGKAYKVKISDFGTDNESYTSDYYKLDGKLGLPIRWMAWESAFLVSKTFRGRSIWHARYLGIPLVEVGEVVYKGLTFLHFFWNHIHSPVYCSSSLSP